ncbi:MAG: hypothetical protein KDK61_08620 [Simkania sp.]|nr:hypothetical protein [Nanoarchaeota archaeon]MCB1084361.1 hypothetical protein [Simkania sp.]
MKINQTVVYLALGLLLLPVAFILLLLQGGVVATTLSVFFFLVSISFLAISTRRIITKELLRKPYFWALLIGAILVLMGMILIYF